MQSKGFPSKKRNDHLKFDKTLVGVVTSTKISNFNVTDVLFVFLFVFWHNCFDKLSVSPPNFSNLGMKIE